MIIIKLCCETCSKIRNPTVLRYDKTAFLSVITSQKETPSEIYLDFIAILIAKTVPCWKWIGFSTPYNKRFYRTISILLLKKLISIILKVISVFFCLNCVLSSALDK